MLLTLKWKSDDMKLYAKKKQKQKLDMTRLEVFVSLSVRWKTSRIYLSKEFQLSVEYGLEEYEMSILKHNCSDENS